MRDITFKKTTLRTATAIGVVTCKEETLTLIKNNALPKGNILDVAKAAGLLGAKQTQHLIPHCHPVHIDNMVFEFEYLTPGNHIEGLSNLESHFGIIIKGTAKAIDKTGIEMEILTGISVAALTIYDLLKPVDKEVEITSIKLLEKRGGKSDREKYYKDTHHAAVLVCSDSVSRGDKEDRSGVAIKEKLENYNTDIVDYQVVSDDPENIKAQLVKWTEKGVPFIFTTGGTGVGPRDNTTEVVKSIIKKEVPGIAETMRSYGGARTPLAATSRSIAGIVDNTIIISMPGSTKGVEESLEAILPWVFHMHSIIKGGGHE